jgi:hypothetical protein
MASPSDDSSGPPDRGPTGTTDNSFNPATIFNVEDLVVVITGGGTGE